MASTTPKKRATKPRSERGAGARASAPARGAGKPARSGGSTVRVSRGGRSPHRASSRVVELRAQRMLEVLGLDGAELSVALVDDAAIHELNLAYRRKDKPTDVLSFAQHDDALARAAERSKSGRSDLPSLLLGDVIVSLDTAARQAEERARPLLAELTTLLAHGILHLAGFDHRTDDEEREMNAYAAVLEAAALGKQPLKLALRRP